jgi:hypothetical protein
MFNNYFRFKLELTRLISQLCQRDIQADIAQKYVYK